MSVVCIKFCYSMFRKKNSHIVYNISKVIYLINSMFRKKNPHIVYNISKVIDLIKSKLDTEA